MKFHLLFFTFFLSLLTFSQRSYLDTVIIEPHKSFQNYEHFKRLVLKTSDPRIDFLIDLNFEWGIRKIVVIKVNELGYVQSDGTNHTFSYVKTIDEKKASSKDTFLLHLTGNLYYTSYENEAPIAPTIMEVDVLNYRYFDEVNIIVPKKHNERFKLIMEGKREDSALLVYENATTIRLINFR